MLLVYLAVDIRKSLPSDIIQKLNKLTMLLQISNPSQEAISKSALIVAESSRSPNFVRQILSSIAKMVNDLLLVTSCRVHNSSSSSNSAAGLMDQVSPGHKNRTNTGFYYTL